jgi:hypothetical protein
MAGVVNLVLNNRLQGFNADFDYGINEVGDGQSPHVSLSGGTSLFGGQGHALFGAEWQHQTAIRDCAAARDWCRESRALFTNYTGSGQILNSVFTSVPGYEAFPARFEVTNVRYGQFAPTGMIASTSTNNTSGLRFSDNGRDVEEFAFGFRGGAGGAGSGLGTSVMNGDGPLLTSGTTVRPGNDRKTLFLNFEYDLNSRTTVYFQGNYVLQLRAFQQPWRKRYKRRRRRCLVQRRVRCQRLPHDGWPAVWPGRSGQRQRTHQVPEPAEPGFAQRALRSSAPLAWSASRKLIVRVRQQLRAGSRRCGISAARQSAIRYIHQFQRHGLYRLGQLDQCSGHCG